MLSALIFPCFYIGLVFLCVALTVLSVHQLSDSAKYRFRYLVLGPRSLIVRSYRFPPRSQIVRSYRILQSLPVLPAHQAFFQARGRKCLLWFGYDCRDVGYEYGEG